MKQTILIAFMLFIAYASMAQKESNSSPTKNNTEMKTYVIEREIPNAGNLTATPSAVAGLMIEETWVILLAGNPPFCACSLMSSSFSAL